MLMPDHFLGIAFLTQDKESTLNLREKELASEKETTFLESSFIRLHKNRKEIHIYVNSVTATT